MSTTYRYINPSVSLMEEVKFPSIWKERRDINTSTDIKPNMTAKEMADVFSQELIEVVRKDFEDKKQKL